MTKLKYIIIILVYIILCSCDTVPKKPIKYIEGDTYRTSLITLTVNKNSHEFVSLFNGNGNYSISHWPDCKYCKK